jgi:FlaA1/EpsC-like NDP-sugar epimerase
VLIGDQLLIVFGLLSALFASYRLVSLDVFPMHTIIYRVLVHMGLAIISWVGFKIYKKVIRFFNSKDYLNLIGIIFLIHLASIAVGYFFPPKYLSLAFLSLQSISSEADSSSAISIFITAVLKK